MFYLGTDVDVIARRMSRLEPIAMRMEVKEGINNCLLINDSYNSDINSLGARFSIPSFGGSVDAANIDTFRYFTVGSSVR